MKRKKIIISLTIISLGIIITSYFIVNQNNQPDLHEEKIHSKVSTNAISMMLETKENSGVYEPATDSTWPQDGYVFNETLSKCENGSELSWDDTSKAVIMKGSVSDKCYVYFDVYVPPLSNGSVSINNDATYAINKSVTLNLNATSASEMCISNTTSCSSWENYATSKNWTLTSDDGTKTVYVTFRNESGKTLGPTSDTIIYDGTAPTLSVSALTGMSSSSPTIVYSASYTVSGTASDSISKLKSVTVNDSAATIDGNNWSKTITLTRGTTTAVTVVATDNAGKSTTITRYVRYDTYPQLWNDGFDGGNIYAYPNTPSTTYAGLMPLRLGYGPDNFKAKPYYIKTTITEHQACIYLEETNKEFCIGKNYWDTNGTTTKNKLKTAMQTSLGINESTLNCDYPGGGAYCYVSGLMCNVRPDGGVDCGALDTYCSIYGDGSARCGSGAP